MLNRFIIQRAFVQAILWGCILTLSFFTYQFFTKHYSQIFDLDRNASWAEAFSTSFDPSRGVVKTKFDQKEKMFLLSREAFGDFTFAVDLLNLDDSGVLYQYQNQENFKYVFYSQKEQKIYWGNVVDGKSVVKSEKSSIVIGDLPVVIVCKDAHLQFFFRKQLVLEAKGDQLFGRLGLMSNRAQSPKAFFRHISLSGKSAAGEYKQYIHIASWGPKYIFCISLIYFLLWLSLAIGFKEKNRIVQAIKEMGLTDWLFFCFGWVVLYEIFVLLEGVVLNNFLSTYLWMNMGVAVLAYILVGGTAFFLQKYFRELDFISVFMGVLFFLYALSIVSINFIPAVHERWALWAVFAAGIAGLVILRRRDQFFVRREPLSSDPVRLGIFLWGLHVLIFFLSINFTLNRKPFVDEVHLWYTAAANMVKDGYLTAHLAYYPGGSMHAFAVPFIISLPVKLFGVNFAHALFFMPLMIVAGFVGIFRALSRRKKTLLFFMVSFFMVFNMQNWFIELVFGSVYADGIFMLAIFILSIELMKIVEKNTCSLGSLMSFGLLCGVFALCKSSAVFICFVFAVSAMMRSWASRELLPWKIYSSLGVLVLVFLPFVIWKMFIHAKGLSFLSLPLSVDIFSKTFNHELMNNISLILNVSYKKAFLFALASAIFVVVGFRRWEYLCVLPVATFLAGFFIYYGYLYEGTDAVSSVRYLTAIVPATFYLGAEGFSKFLQRIRAPQ